MAEYWDILDENRVATGRTHIRGIPLIGGEYHLVVQIWVYNSRGELLLSRRHPNKHFPLYWECTGGSVTAGETSLTGAVRELSEELGLHVREDELKLIRSVRRKNDFLDDYIVRRDCEISQLELQPTEVIDAKWVSTETFAQMLQKGDIVPWLGYIMQYYDKYMLPKHNIGTEE